MNTKSTDGVTRQPVWDLPTRLFHWLLVVLIGFSWWSAENDQLDLHIWSGLAVLALLIFRLLWGIFGSSTARFANFVRGPRAVLAYLKNMKAWRPIGHSPLGALSVLALLAVIAVQVGLGLFAVDHDGFYEGPLAYLVSHDLAEVLTELHEELFNILLVFIGLHIAAILLYRFVLGKKLVGPMVTGKGEVGPGIEPMRAGRWWVALLCLATAIAVTRWIIAGVPPFGG
jgi:cytochrome b